jgi:hypothetical protein
VLQVLLPDGTRTVDAVARSSFEPVRLHTHRVRTHVALTLPHWSGAAPAPTPPDVAVN